MALKSGSGSLGSIRKTWLPGKHQVFSLRSAFGFSSDAFDSPKQSQRLQGAAVPCTQRQGHVRQRLLTPADSEPDHRHGQQITDHVRHSVWNAIRWISSVCMSSRSPPRIRKPFRLSEVASSSIGNERARTSVNRVSCPPPPATRRFLYVARRPRFPGRAGARLAGLFAVLPWLARSVSDGRGDRPRSTGCRCHQG